MKQNAGKLSLGKKTLVQGNAAATNILFAGALNILRCPAHHP